MAECVVRVDPGDMEWQEQEAFAGVLCKQLYENRQTGQTFELLMYKKDYVEPRHTHHKGGHAIYVIRGAIIDAKTDKVLVPGGHFWYAPKDDVHGPFKNPPGTLILFVTDCALDFVVVE